MGETSTVDRPRGEMSGSRLNYTALPALMAATFGLSAAVLIASQKHCKTSINRLRVLNYSHWQRHGQSRCRLSLSRQKWRLRFLRATAATEVARLSHRHFVCLSVCPYDTRVDQSKTVQARITKSLPSAAWKTLVSESVKLFHKFEKGHPDRGR